MAGATRVDPGGDDPIVFGEVPSFRFVDHEGAPFGLAELRGQPWVLAAIFTTCAGPCPKIIAGLGQIEDRLRAAGASIVCLSVDPEYDTPEVLARFARRYEVGEGWRFLTGPESEVHELLATGFSLGVARADDEPAGYQVTHATRVVAIDGAGRIRGWYSGVDDAGLEALAERVEHLVD